MKKCLFVLLMAVFVVSIGIGTADAAWTSGFGTTKKICLYSNSTSLATSTADTNVYYTLGAGESLATQDAVYLILSGGAKFSTSAPTFTVYPPVADSTILNSGGTLSQVGATTGQTTANFSLTGPIPSGQSLILNSGIDVGIFDLTAASGNVDLEIKAVKAGGAGTIAFDKVMSTTATIGMYAFTGPAACETTSIGAKTDTVDVSATGGPYTKFTVAPTNTGTATNANYQLVPASVPVPAAVPVSPKKVLWTIAGNLAGVTAINASAANKITGSDATGSQTGGTANVFLINSAKTFAYGSNTSAIPTTPATADPQPQFVIDGTTAQSARSFTCQIDVLADGTNWAAHNAVPATTLWSISRNGVSFTTNSVGTRNTIKITDRSGNLPTAGGAILVTAYDVNGNALALASSAPSLVLLNNATTTITGATLASMFTGTAMRYEFAVQTASALATNVKVSTDGANTNTLVYTNTPGAI